MNTNYSYKEAYTGIAADEGWHHQLEQDIVEVCDGVWAFIGCGSSVFSVIKSEHGYILIDTGDNPTRARGALDFIAQHAPGALQGVILTHSHPNHRVSGFVFTEKSIEDLRTLAGLKPEAVVCGHILALRGADVVDEFLSSYAEALEYVYQATIAGMNEGKTADELAAEIRLPEHLRSKPYLAEYYGNVAWSARSIFAHKVGWFDGNPAHIAPLSPDEEALRIAKLAGGAKNLVAQAQNALDTGDERWAARLAQWAIACEDGALDEADVAHAHEVLADAYERMAARVLPITAKNYLQTAALEERASLRLNVI